MTSLVGNDRMISTNGVGGHASGNSSGSTKMPFRHIDDLVLVGVDLDPHTPLRKILELGDAHMRQATTYNDFRRPDLALQEYIKAFTIAVDKVPKHKDYPSLKSDRGDLGRLYNALKTKIRSAGSTFEKIKEDIKEDNRRSGVQPTVSSKNSSEIAGPISSNIPKKAAVQAQASITNHSDANSSTGHKPKPPVHPKPQALHGKAIKQTPTLASQDLASRFARLRDSQRPGASIKATDQSQPPALLDTSVPTMPKLPEAIYSPARGTVTSEVANLPSSAPRGMFSRTNSMTSAPSVAAWASTDNAIASLNRNQFVTAHTYRTPQPSTPNQPKIPTGDTITPKTLGSLMNQKHPKVEILIIDVRDRETFDEGHINYPGTICVEPEILMRENISADDIADSMVLAPSNERLAFEQRDKVDLVVIYDQDSDSVPSRITGNSLEMIMYNLQQALSYYSYNRPLKHNPKLLKGGLSSWIYEFGEQFVEVSNTASKYMPTSARSTRGYSDKGRYRAKTRTLSQNEINQFEDLIKKDQTGASEFDYIKTKEDFIRRYPSITGDPESMISTAIAEQEALLAGIAPAPPRRPAPTIPRTRYSGLDSRDDHSGVGGLAMVSSAELSIEPTRLARERTGLWNDGVTCYCNSTVQALLASPGFIDEIINNEWPEVWRANPDREPSRPQLLAKILKNLLQWMHKREFKQMKITTLLRYMYSVHEGFRDENTIHKLGDGQQHDIDELTNFIFTQLSAETDITSTIESDQPALPEIGGVPARIAREYMKFWTGQRKFTFVDRHFSGFNINLRRCYTCKSETYLSDSNHTYIFTPEERKDKKRVLLTDMIDDEWSGEDIIMHCDNCRSDQLANVSMRLAKLPRLLRIYVRRYAFDRNRLSTVKTSVPLEFPLELDLAPYAWSLETRREVAALLGGSFSDGFAVPTEYQLYAIQVHQGVATNSGHYWTWARGDTKGEWVMLDDSNVKSHRDASWEEHLQEMYDCPHQRTPVQLFYKRKDIHVPWHE
ncbi:cysteine proteinase [Hypoxylon sp. NC0597]|nr:cysteine proteinase [Hypoxylon sp. NC0597]